MLNKTLMLLLLPIICAIFFAGWFLYVIGRPGSGTPKKQTKTVWVTVGGIEQVEVKV